MLNENIAAKISHKIKTFQSDPTGSIKAKSESLRRALLASWARSRLEQNSVVDTISAFVNSRPQVSIAPDFSDLWFLYHSVRERKPRNIIEFGSGCSTAVLAKALIDNGHGHLISIDAEPHWAASTAKALPSSLHRVCEVLYRPALEVDYAGTPAFRHANVPDVIPNFVYLDGPPLTSERQVAIDVLDMEDRLPSDFFLVVDGRRRNTDFLRKHLKKSYSFKRRGVFNNSVFLLNS